MKQVAPYSTWPSGMGWTVAILDRDPRELASDYGLHFEDGCDDLDAYQLAAVGDRAVGQLWLFRHEHSPDTGVEVPVDARVSRQAAVAALRRYFSPQSIVWLVPEEHSPWPPSATAHEAE